MEPLYPQFHAAFAQFLRDAVDKHIVIVGHARPDGDCIGSQAALARVLRQRGIRVTCANPDPVPRRVQFAAADLSFARAEALALENVEAVFVDCADLARAGDRFKARFPTPFANFDHHLSNVGFAQTNFVDVGSAATCEILAGLFLDQGLEIDPQTAQALYAGIATDTGQFRFGSTTRRTFLLAAELMARGAQPAAAAAELYERETFAKLQLLQRFLASLRLECGGRVCVGILPLGIYEETGTTTEDAEGLVDYARSIDGVEIGVLVEEQSSGIKGSLRSKNPVYRVDRVAAKFNGGGHACAAGLNAKGISLDAFLPGLVAAIGDRLAEVDNPNPS